MSGNKMSRIIEIDVHDEAVSKITYCPDFYRAIGYASMWGNSQKVSIYVDKDMSISTSHQRLNDKDMYEQYFFMMGILDASKNTYSFHS